MALHKRIYYGFNGYQVPPTPRATRSPRTRSIPRKRTDENQMRAFDLLATVAGNILLEGNNSNSSSDVSNNNEHSASLEDSFEKEEHNIDKISNAELSSSGVCSKSFFVSELVNRSHILNNCLKERPHAQGDPGSGPASVITTSDCSMKIDSPEQIVSDRNKFLLGNSTRIAGSELSVSKVSVSCKLDCESKTHMKNESSDKGAMTVRNMANKFNSNCLVTGTRNPSVLLASDRSVKFSFNKDHKSSGFLPVDREGVKLGIRDDDENSGCIQPRTVNKAFRSCNGDRIRDSVSSHCWKVNPAMKGDPNHFDADRDRNHFPQDKNNSCKPQLPVTDYPIKKRKLYDYSSISKYSGGTNEDDCGSTPKGSTGNGPTSFMTSTGVTGPSNSSGVEHASRQRRDVKLKIKSFRVPELFIEIPETATVGSLKRTVMEAVMAILGDGLHVGVVLQGKKIKEDSRTLLQTGISHNNKPDALSFILEPNCPPAPISVYAKSPTFLRSRESPKPLPRYTDAQNLVHDSVRHKAATKSSDVPGSNSTNFVESDHDSAPSPPDMSQDKSVADSKVLVAVPPTNAEAQNMVPMRKPKRSESARRIRRPFTVSEVEALVQAVEKLGTGRWRDVKLRAFDNAKHRTYVDLKDKWKTLVHTARISPQQRRGEPVPQELLDRVLLAHAYWSQQAKQQLKLHSEARLLL
ncbi:hypothetical protein LIER_01456 [Lithospermum erythrorhizon]|uniref:Telomere repeat-binding protein 5 n=1 Tax=Lithospermum erythrorhizon TaxID=34254 RepID=A0AAV3NQJ9_LITER